MDEAWIRLIIACLGSSALFSFIQFLITRKDNSRKLLNDIKSSLVDASEKLKKTNEKLNSLIRRIINVESKVNTIDRKVKDLENKVTNLDSQLNLMETQMKESRSRFKELEKGLTRTQLLVLIRCFPNKDGEILKIGERYFKTLKGDWYVTSIFNDYLNKKGIADPSWFKNDGETYDKTNVQIDSKD